MNNSKSNYVLLKNSHNSSCKKNKLVKCCCKKTCSKTSTSRVMNLKERLTSSRAKKFYHRLPDAARTILALMKSDDILIRIIGRYGGCSLNVPAKWPPVGKDSKYRGHPLRRVLTPKQMLEMVKHYGGTALYVPNCNKFLKELRNDVIVKSFIRSTRKGASSGKVVQRLARRYKLSDRRIWEILKAIPNDADVDKSN